MSRNTRQRSAIQNAIEQAGRPLSPAEILVLAQAGAPALGIATVYRNIKTLLEDGRIREVALPGEPPRYERAHLGHHHHFKCRSCNKVFDIDECHTDWSQHVPTGFLIERHDLTLFGRCRDCTGTTGTDPSCEAKSGHTHCAGVPTSAAGGLKDR